MTVLVRGWTSPAAASCPAGTSAVSGWSSGRSVGASLRCLQAHIARSHSHSMRTQDSTHCCMYCMSTQHTHTLAHKTAHTRTHTHKTAHTRSRRLSSKGSVFGTKGTVLGPRKHAFPCGLTCAVLPPPTASERCLHSAPRPRKGSVSGKKDTGLDQESLPFAAVSPSAVAAPLRP